MTDVNVYVSDLFGVAGKVVVVTGGGRGIGEMIAEGFVKGGARVYIASRDADVLGQTADRLAEFGECIALPADLGSVEGVHALAAEISRREQQVHVLVNNAGTAWGGPIDTYSAEGFERVLNVNLKGVFLLTQQLLPLLRAAASSADPARVINIGSVNGLSSPKAGTNNWAYSASKAGVRVRARWRRRIVAAWCGRAPCHARARCRRRRAG